MIFAGIGGGGYYYISNMLKEKPIRSGLRMPHFKKPQFNMSSFKDMSSIKNNLILLKNNIQDKVYKLLGKRPPQRPIGRGMSGQGGLQAQRFPPGQGMQRPQQAYPQQRPPQRQTRSWYKPKPPSLFKPLTKEDKEKRKSLRLKQREKILNAFDEKSKLEKKEQPGKEKLGLKKK